MFAPVYIFYNSTTFEMKLLHGGVPVKRFFTILLENSPRYCDLEERDDKRCCWSFDQKQAIKAEITRY